MQIDVQALLCHVGGAEVEFGLVDLGGRILANELSKLAVDQDKTRAPVFDPVQIINAVEQHGQAARLHRKRSVCGMPSN